MPIDISDPDPTAEYFFEQLGTLMAGSRRNRLSSSLRLSLAQCRAGYGISSVTPIRSEELTEADFIIALAGPADAGKDNFIQLATSQGSQSSGTGHSPKQGTAVVTALRISFTDNVNVVLVNIPGFDAVRFSGLRILEITLNWLQNDCRYDLCGILYLHPLSNNRMSGAPDDLVALQRLQKEDFFGKVTAVVTICSKEGSLDGYPCIAQWENLRPSYRVSAIAGESKAHWYFENTQQSAWNIIDHIILTESKQQRALVQEELAYLRKKLTGAVKAQPPYCVTRELVERQIDLLRRMTEELKKAEGVAPLQVLLSELSELNEAQKKRKDIVRDIHKPDPSFLGVFFRQIFSPIRHQDPIAYVDAEDGSSDDYSTLRELLDPIREVVRRLTEKVLSNKYAYKALLESKGSTAKTALGILQKLLDNQGIPKKLRRSALYGTIRLCAASGVYPQCLTLQGVSYDDVPVASGGFGDIWKGHYKARPICLKVPRVYQRMDIEQLIKSFAREVIVWSQLNHPNVLPFYGLYYLEKPRGCIGLVSPWMQQGNVNQYLKSNPEVARLPLVHDILAGLVYLHEQDIVHGDLKAENILISPCGSACLADFGLSSVVDPTVMQWTSLRTTTKTGGTVRWQAPELMYEVEDNHSPQPTLSSDVYSVGSVMYEIITGMVPFYEFRNVTVVMARVLGGKRPSKPPPGMALEFSDKLWKVMQKCWEHAPKKRPAVRWIAETLHDIPQPQLTISRLVHHNPQNARQNDRENETLLTPAFRDAMRGYSSFSGEEIGLLKEFEGLSYLRENNGTDKDRSDGRRSSGVVGDGNKSSSSAESSADDDKGDGGIDEIHVFLESHNDGLGGGLQICDNGRVNEGEVMATSSVIMLTSPKGSATGHPRVPTVFSGEER